MVSTPDPYFVMSVEDKEKSQDAEYFVAVAANTTIKKCGSKKKLFRATQVLKKSQKNIQMTLRLFSFIPQKEPGDKANGYQNNNTRNSD